MVGCVIYKKDKDEKNMNAIATRIKKMAPERKEVKKNGK